jgi:hypothetical protein
MQIIYDITNMFNKDDYKKYAETQHIYKKTPNIAKIKLFQIKQ